VRFTWDISKAARNLARHGVSFIEASSAFDDPLARIHDDPGHSDHEEREIIVGHSRRGRLLVVSFTERKGSVRLITARVATKAERFEYEEGIE
jgi:uncharacterized DUF497 family protein